ncbi:MAG: sugar ABC transporter ATP-binding protein [Armatimonadetes bacterium]|nr:sugar ABC transporter ATP-binding protein [Armatimonadota bacterium]
MEGITKRFPGVQALDRVNLELYPGEILGLIGENGAGKSTLMRILAGIYPADDGSICIEGRPAPISGVEDSLALGISIIHQELNLADNLDIASNIFLGREMTLSPLRILRNQAITCRAEELMASVGLDVPATTLVEKLSPGQQQLVEIAKALSMSARILVLDEPTSSLAPREAEGLFAVMRRLKAAGVSMVYISHRLPEVEEICDRVIVLRDGERVGALDRGEISRDAMVRLMVGRDISRFFPDAGSCRGEPAMAVRDFRPAQAPGPFDFEVRRGEILGLFGLMGAGRTELARSLFGIEPAVSGEILLCGKPAAVRNSVDAIRHGIGMVPEDRKNLGVILQMAVRENISLPDFCSACAGIGLMNEHRESQIAAEQIEALDIRTTGIEQQVEFLSGGNQQKVALAKWLAIGPKVLILDEPTRGIDVGSKSEIYALIRRLADEGLAVVMISSEMEEILGLSDRVLVVHEGRQIGILDRSDATEESVMSLATGGKA